MLGCWSEWTCFIVCGVLVFVLNLHEMADFGLFDEDDYDGMFITQAPKVNKVVSLEENNEKGPNFRSQIFRHK